jgi:anti-sigma regulatory factor (Ser/Thr protein kinase)
MLDQEFTAGSLRLLREAVIAHATAVGMPEGRAADVMLAAHELAANAVRHGGGTGQLRMRIAAGALHIQVSDRGRAPFDSDHPGAPSGRAMVAAVSRQDPWPYRRGHGLGLVREVADQVTAVTGPNGSQVTASFTLPSAC